MNDKSTETKGKGAKVLWRRKRRSTEVSSSTFMEEKTTTVDYCSSCSDDINKEGQKKRYLLVSYKELPEYMKDNEFILRYYRSDWPLKEALFSLFRWHNETLNVWTHLIGFVLFLGLTVANLMQVPQIADFLIKISSWSFPLITETNVSNHSRDFFMGITTGLIGSSNYIIPHDLATASTETIATRWPFFVFLGGAMFCLLTSSICHLFCCHSHTANLRLLRMDYVGIAVMIITSFIPPIFYIFQCEPIWQVTYIGGITIMGIFTIITLLAPKLSTSEYRHLRAFLFSSMGLFGLVPAVHALIVNWDAPKAAITLTYEVVMAVSYLTGVFFYIKRIPERWYPGWFDLAGHSHQIFHVFVLMGALAHYGAALLFLEWRDTQRCEF